MMKYTFSEHGRHFHLATFEQIHCGVLDLLPSGNARLLDVGAGTGRDARALTTRGYHVTAVEPLRRFRDEGRSQTGPTVEWIDDKLPYLKNMEGRKFDFILVSAVWMYIADVHRAIAMNRLSELLATKGVLVISFRPKLPTGDPTSFLSTTASELSRLGIASGLSVIRMFEEPDRLARPTHWSTVAFGRQVNGTGTRSGYPR